MILSFFFNYIEGILENKIQKGCYKKFIGVLKALLTDLSLNKCIWSGIISRLDCQVCQFLLDPVEAQFR